MFICKAMLCFVLVLCFATKVYSDEQHESGASVCGLAFEKLLNKLQTLQDKLIEADQKLVSLSQTIDHKLAVLQTESNAAMKEHRENIDQKLSGLNETMDHKLTILQTATKAAMKELFDQSLSELNETMVHQFTTLKSESNAVLQKYQESSDQKLNQLVQTVDDKFEALQALSNKTEQSVTVIHEQTQKEIQKLASKDGVILYKINPNMFYGTISVPANQISIPSCKHNLSKGSGQYLIVPNKHAIPFAGYCDQSVFGGGWLVFQYRFDGSVDFYRNWDSYRNGFGSLGGEFWLGLEHLHQLTSARKYELLVELKDYFGVYKYALYDEFQIGSEADKYALKKLGSYTGTAGDELSSNKGMNFTTKDQDNDNYPSDNCAVERNGAWWYRACTYSNLNGIYENADGNEYMVWYDFNSSSESLAYARMSIREV